MEEVFQLLTQRTEVVQVELPQFAVEHDFLEEDETAADVLHVEGHCSTEQVHSLHVPYFRVDHCVQPQDSPNTLKKVEFIGRAGRLGEGDFGARDYVGGEGASHILVDLGLRLFRTRSAALTQQSYILEFPLIKSDFPHPFPFDRTDLLQTAPPLPSTTVHVLYYTVQLAWLTFQLSVVQTILTVAPLALATRGELGETGIREDQLTQKRLRLSRLGSCILAKHFDASRF